MRNKELLNILSNYISDTQLLEKISIDSDMFDLVSSQKLSPLVYLVIKKNKLVIDNILEEKLRNHYILATRLDVKQKRIIDDIACFCSVEKIPFAFFKGADLKRLYNPNSEIRTMGDIDVLVPLDKKNDIVNFLLKKNENIKDFREVEEINVGDISIELHEKIRYFGHDILTLNDIVDNQIQDKAKYLFMLIAHIIKHIMSSGCGLRQFLDVAMFIKKENSNIDYESLVCMLDNIGKLKVGLSIIYLVTKWFSVDCSCFFDRLDNYNKSEEFSDTFLNFLCSNGVFGFDDIKNVGANKMLRFKNSKFPKLRTYFYYAFPPIAYLEEIYPKLRRFKILLPYYYMCNIFRKLFKQSAKAKQFCRAINENDINSDRNKFLKSLDIF